MFRSVNSLNLLVQKYKVRFLFRNSTNFLVINLSTDCRTSNVFDSEAKQSHVTKIDEMHGKLNQQTMAQKEQKKWCEKCAAQNKHLTKYES